MIQNIKELLQNAQLQQQVKEAANLAEVIKLITTAGAQKGGSFTQESVAQMISGLVLEDHELTEADLLAVSGGLRAPYQSTDWKSCLYQPMPDSLEIAIC
jgi:methionine salvage enolase-phosphatase E1